MSHSTKNQADQVSASSRLVEELRRSLEQKTENKKGELLEESLIGGEWQTLLPPEFKDYFTLVIILEGELNLNLEASVRDILEAMPEPAKTKKAA